MTGISRRAFFRKIGRAAIGASAAVIGIAMVPKQSVFAFRGTEEVNLAALWGSEYDVALQAAQRAVNPPPITAAEVVYRHAEFQERIAQAIGRAFSLPDEVISCPRRSSES